MTRIGALVSILIALCLIPGTGGAAELREPVPENTMIENPLNKEPMGVITNEFQKKQFFNTTGPVYKLQTYFWRMPVTPPKTAAERFPLVLILHADGGWAHAGVYLTVADMPKRFPAYIAVPVMPPVKRWAWPAQEKSRMRGDPGLRDAVELVRHLAREYPVDPNRIYVIGCADGGAGAYAAALYYPDVFAATVPILGVWDANDAPKMTHVPIWAFHGLNDNTRALAADRKMRDALIKAGATAARYTELPGIGHSCDNPGYYPDQMWQWMFAQTRASGASAPIVTPR